MRASIDPKWSWAYGDGPRIALPWRRYGLRLIVSPDSGNGARVVEI
jgi:hypothetical protein